MKVTKTGERGGNYTSRYITYEVIGCTGYTDDQVKNFIGYHASSGRAFYEEYDLRFVRISDDVVHYEHCEPYLD